MDDSDSHEIRVTVAVHAGDAIRADELARAAGISVASLQRLIRLGLLAPDQGDAFSVPAVLHLRRLLRVRRDLELDLIGAAVVADLLTRIERLESELLRLRGRG